MNLAAEKQPLVSEIIADQQKEIESLKVELQKIKNENPDLLAFETYDELMAAIKKAL